jgi:cobalt-zinc-cadmium efflux system outer membrane protein
VYETFVDRLSEGMGIVERRVAAGEAPPLDRDRFRRELATSRSELVEHRATCLGDWSELAGLMGSEPHRTLDAMPRPGGGFTTKPDAPSSLDAALERVSKAPKLRRHRRQVDALKQQATSVRRSGWPTPSIRGGFRSLHSPAGVDPGFVAGISLPLPVWYRKTGRTRELRAQAGVMQGRYQRILQERRGDMVSAWQRASALQRSAAEFKSTGIQAAQRAVRRARSGYQGGEVSLSAYLGAVRELKRARLRAVELSRKSQLQWVRVLALAGVSVGSQHDAGRTNSQTHQ